MPRKINLELYQEVHAYLQDHTYKNTADHFKISEMQISRIKKYFINQQSEQKTSDNLKEIIIFMLEFFQKNKANLQLTDEERARFKEIAEPYQ